MRVLPPLTNRMRSWADVRPDRQQPQQLRETPAVGIARALQALPQVVPECVALELVDAVVGEAGLVLVLADDDREVDLLHLLLQLALHVGHAALGRVLVHVRRQDEERPVHLQSDGAVAVGAVHVRDVGDIKAQHLVVVVVLALLYRAGSYPLSRFG